MNLISRIFSWLLSLATIIIGIVFSTLTAINKKGVWASFNNLSYSIGMDIADNSSAIVIVPKKQLSLAIGREGQNARLAAKLTNWKIDVQAEEEVEQKTVIPNQQQATQEQSTTLTKEKITEGAPEVLPVVNQSEIQSEEIIDSEIFAESKSSNEQEELRVLEKEIEDLEKQELEEARKAKEKETILDFSSEEIWNIGGSKKSEKSDDKVIRFAEDIESVNVYNSNSTKSKKSNKKKRTKR